MKTVRYGIIGAGDIAKKFVDACNRVEGAEVVSVAARSLEKAQNFAEKFQVKNAYGSYQELVDDEEVDAVYIAVINVGHFPAIEMAAKAGKAILCEKPAIMTVEQANRLKELVAENDILFMEALWTVFLPAVQMAKKWVDEGRIGILKSIDATFSFHGQKVPGSRVFDKDLMGGGLVDVGVYCIALCMHMTGEEPLDVKAMEYVGDTGVDEYGSVMLRFPKDIIAEGHYGIGLFRATEAFIYGSEGYIEVEDFVNGKQINLFNRQNELLDTFVGDHENGFVYEVEHFTQLYLEGKKDSDVHPVSKSLAYADIYDKVRAQR